MNPALFLQDIVDPSLKKLNDWTGVGSDDRGRLEVMTIAGQEGNWQFRRQIGGPARSFFQFERGGGVHGLFTVTAVKLKAVCDALDIPYEESSVFEAMAWNDTLACCMARLLLWTDPKPLPDVGDERGAWLYYVNLWRPGMPRPETWPARYATSLQLVTPKGK